MTSETDTIEIPPRALVHCPKHKFALRRVVKCEGCEDFAGLNEKMRGESIPFDGAYTVVCIYPISRAILLEAED
jgi:hypothetical protein